MAGEGLVIVSDGSGLPEPVRGDPAGIFAALAMDVRLLRDHTFLNPSSAVVAARGVDELAAAVRALPASATALFLARTDPLRARAVQRDVARSRRIPIVTEEDTLGIALAAAALVTLHRAGIALPDARVVVAGADKVPLLALLLMAAGVGDIASWTTVDAEGFPLSGVARGASLVIDLADAAGTIRPVFGDEMPLTIVRPGDPVAHLLALPGLLRALWDVPTPGWAGDPARQVEVHRAGARALAALAPVDRGLPELADPDLTCRVAQAVVDVLRQPHSR
ncbi:MAG TPA: hypothetical protein VJX66_07820 [Amycolatopsis sp.]|nr:hypothetical protein [Amycolatopsis sp.]